MLALSSLVFIHFFIIVNKEHFSCSFFLFQHEMEKFEIDI